MQTRAFKIVLIAVGVILLAIGLLNIVPDVLYFISSNAASTTLMIKTPWVLMVVFGVLLCVVSLFIRKKQG